MDGVLIGVVIVVAALVLWLVLQTSQEQKKSAALEAQLGELRRDLQTIGTAQAQSTGQMATIGQSVSQRLESVTKALQDGVSNSAQIATQGQTAIADELKNTREQIGHIQKQLGEFQELGRGISSATKSLEGILGGAKTRGLLGEVALERLLEDSLPSSQYATQYRFSSGEAADAVIFLRDKKLVAVDSKFPLDAFRRISAEGEEAKRAFATAVKGHADSIAKKYIVPNEGTLDLALMFVPSETVYYEMLMTLDSKGEALDSYCRGKNIIAVSPNTLYAHLCVIHLGLRGMQIEENAKRISAGLSGIQKNMATFTDVFEKLGTHLKNAQQSYGEADKRLEKTQNTLDSLVGTSAADASLENGQGTLALPAEAGAKTSA
ncbi:MAG TPA: DNA recombination protein RmuC [Verrucomicrobiae bacterium]|jgi:DNA recombination protein RmuC|nr:DNA recombination protein RmuC [Verrucomicrobiae bacterium]